MWLPWVLRLRRAWRLGRGGCGIVARYRNRTGGRSGRRCARGLVRGAGALRLAHRIGPGRVGVGRGGRIGGNGRAAFAGGRDLTLHGWVYDIRDGRIKPLMEIDRDTTLEAVPHPRRVLLTEEELQAEVEATEV